MSPRKIIKQFTVNGDGKPSLKRNILTWTWLWTIFIVTLIITIFLINPTPELSGGLVGLSTLIGIPLSAAYMGMLMGEYNNRKDKEVLAKLPSVPSSISSIESQ